MNELGYKLADSQRNLTTLQKFFLFYAYPIFNEIQKKRGEDPNYDPTQDRSLMEHGSESQHRESWKQQYLKRLEAKQKELQEQGV